MEVHPGDPVFHTQSYSQLFTECLTPQQCGFEPGESFVDSLLADIQPGNPLSVQVCDAKTLDVMSAAYRAEDLCFWVPGLTSTISAIV